MAFTQADRDAVDRAIIALASGERVRRIQFTDRLVEYADPPSLADLKKLLATINQDLAGGGARRVPFAGRTWNAIERGKGL